MLHAAGAYSDPELPRGLQCMIFDFVHACVRQRVFLIPQIIKERPAPNPPLSDPHLTAMTRPVRFPDEVWEFIVSLIPKDRNARSSTASCIRPLCGSRFFENVSNAFSYTFVGWDIEQSTAFGTIAAYVGARRSITRELRYLHMTRLQMEGRPTIHYLDLSQDIPSLPRRVRSLSELPRYHLRIYRSLDE